MSSTFISPNAIKDNSIAMSKLAEDVIEAISAGAGGSADNVLLYTLSLSDFNAEKYNELLATVETQNTLIKIVEAPAYIIYSQMPSGPYTITNYYQNGEGYSYVVLQSFVTGINFGNNNPTIGIRALKLDSNGQVEEINMNFNISGDEELSETSTNPVQNKTVALAIAGLEERIAALETALANASLVAKVSASEYQEMVNNGTANDEYLYVITEDDTTEA